VSAVEHGKGRPPRDGGVSLPELIVTMMLISVLSLVVLGLVSSISRTFTRDRSATDSTNIAAVGMNEITRVIRSGTEIPMTGGRRPVFIAAGAEFLEMHAFLDTSAADPQPVKVRFEVSGSRDLTEHRWFANAASEPNWTFVGTATSPSTSRVIARKISPVAAAPVFQYYDSLDRDAVALVIPGSGFTATQLASIVRVEVTLSVQADLTARAEPVVLTNTVGIPNLGVNLLGAATP